MSSELDDRGPFDNQDGDVVLGTIGVQRSKEAVDEVVRAQPLGQRPKMVRGEPDADVKGLIAPLDQAIGVHQEL